MIRYKINPLLLKYDEVEQYKTPVFLEKIYENVMHFNGRIASYFVYHDKGKLYAMAIIMFDSIGEFSIIKSQLDQKLFSLRNSLPQIYNFEREIFEQYPDAIEGEGLKPLRFHKPFMGKNEVPLIGDMEFYEVDSHEIHQVSVGPVHAGIIEPGHFRFNCYGEKILTLEISLGYQHRGIEKSLLGGPYKDSFYKIQTLAGDSTIAHTLAYLMNIENLTDIQIDFNSSLNRMIALELERIANHVGDLGGLSTDVGFLPTASYCGRLRGDFLNMIASICGNRFGRNLLRFGGEYVEKSVFEKILGQIELIKPELIGAIDLLWNTPSVMGRFENTGILPKEIATQLGIVGLALRACGINNDIRKDYPFLNYSQYFKMIENDDLNGDVLARGLVRYREILKSLDMITQMISDINDNKNKRIELKKLRKNSISLSFTEGFRGEIVHVAITNKEGKFIRYKIVDPSFHNWNALAYVVRNEGIYDFPLCNKSFNLSYCGFDL